MPYSTRFWSFVVTALVLGPLTAPDWAADTDIVINEIMYHPPLQLDELQYVELFNRGDRTVNLSGWSFKKGISFEFPPRTELPGGGYLVICRNIQTFASNYGAAIPVVGDFSGRLSHRGEKLELCNAAGTVIDVVSYSDHSPWPTAPDGHSTSLERICPFGSGNDPGNWAGSVLPVFEKPAGSPGRRNDNFSSKPVPFIENVTFKHPAPQSSATVTAEVRASSQIKSVILLYRMAVSGGQMPETAVPMERISGDASHGIYQASIAGLPDGKLIRWRVKAEDQAGLERFNPLPTETQPTYSYSTIANNNTARVAFAYVINVGRPQAGQKPENVLDRAVALAGYKPDAANLTKDALLRNLNIAEKLGCLNAEGLAKMRHGNAPNVLKGPYKGDELSVDHIIPRAVVPELDNVILDGNPGGTDASQGGGAFARDEVPD
jgi:hypothetical protein